MGKIKVLTGADAVAYGAKICEVEVIAAYPITPQTHVVETLSEFVANGELDAEYIRVESEHSAISATTAASAAGVRTFTATSSQGLALMHEILFITSGIRAPVVMGVTNRALSAPINIWCDHQDSIAQRDTGWLQFYVESSQEALDSIIMAYKISENENVLLPSMVCFDGYVLSHTVEPFEIPDTEEVRRYLPKYNPTHSYIDPENPMTIGPLGDPNWFMEFKKQQYDAMEDAKEIVKKETAEFEKSFGRGYGNGLVEKYKEGEISLIAMGSVAGTCKEVVDRTEDIGFLRLRTYRPFPKEDLKEALKDAKVVAVIERDISFGMGGAVYSDLTAALSTLEEPPIVVDFISGLGGRDITPKNIEQVIEISKKVYREGKAENIVNWIGLR